MQGLSCAFEVRGNQDDLVAKLLAENARLKQAVARHGVFLPADVTPKSRQRPATSPAPTISSMGSRRQGVSSTGSHGHTVSNGTGSPGHTVSNGTGSLDTQSQTAQEAPDTQSPTAQARMRDTPMQLPLQDQSRRLQTLQNRSHPARSNRGMHQKPSKQRSCRS